jgi:hypothetical protein
MDRMTALGKILDCLPLAVQRSRPRSALDAFAFHSSYCIAQQATGQLGSPGATTTQKLGAEQAFLGYALNTPAATVGWTLNGRPIRATFLYHADHDHPVFLVNRPDIPQPGAFSHFHWLGSMPVPGGPADGYMLQLTAVDRFCFIHHGAEAATSAETCRDKGGVNVDPGIDIATHLNIVTSASPDP